MYYALGIIILVAILFLIVFHFRKKRIMRKVSSMSLYEKTNLLNELAEPLGYEYEPSEDIFTSTLSAWQRTFGYTDAYDRLAPFSNMIFDALPVYFDYDGKTWLIEFWKGQYGINTGCEVGIYHADRILSKAERATTVFQAATDEELLPIQITLISTKYPYLQLQRNHWWLTMFSLGRFSKPKHLTLEATLQFPNYDMLCAFLSSLEELGYDRNKLQTYYTSVTICFTEPLQNVFFLKRMYHHYVLFKNHVFCLIYRLVTRPFSITCDKLLYLYFYLPFAFRRLLQIKSYRQSLLKKRS